MKPSTFRISRAPLLVTATLAFLLAAAFQTATAAAPKTLAVLMYADWCQSCKVLDPKLQAVQPGFNHGDILFLRFDFSNEGTAHQSKLLAQSLGLEDLYESNGGRTGFMVLVDGATAQPLARITARQSESEIADALRGAANR